MAHHHDHHDDTYYLDQLCLVALSAAFGGVCLTLYFWQTNMLNLMLGKQFHNFVGASGVVLVVLAVVRAASLWIAVGKTTASCCDAHHHHDHDHGHDHHVHEAGHPHHHHDHGRARSINTRTIIITIIITVMITRTFTLMSSPILTPTGRIMSTTGRRGAT
jgi:hypothetical protein